MTRDDSLAAMSTPDPATGISRDDSIDDGRLRVTSGTPWEGRVGYSRAIRVGNQVLVTGTMASMPDGTTVHPGDAGAQTTWILGKIEAALEAAGASIRDVVRTRMYVTNINDQAAVGAAHHAVFGDVRPCATMLEVTALASPDTVVEIEVDAIVGDG